MQVNRGVATWPEDIVMMSFQNESCLRAFTARDWSGNWLKGVLPGMQADVWFSKLKTQGKTLAMSQGWQVMGPSRGIIKGTHTSTCTRQSALKHVQGLKSMRQTCDRNGHVKSMSIPVTFISNLLQPRLVKQERNFTSTANYRLQLREELRFNLNQLRIFQYYLGKEIYITWDSIHYLKFSWAFLLSTSP